jgi:hypothetical protein
VFYLYLAASTTASTSTLAGQHSYLVTPPTTLFILRRLSRTARHTPEDTPEDVLLSDTRRAEEGAGGHAGTEGACAGAGCTVVACVEHARGAEQLRRPWVRERVVEPYVFHIPVPVPPAITHTRMHTSSAPGMQQMSVQGRGNPNQISSRSEPGSWGARGGWYHTHQHGGEMR